MTDRITRKEVEQLWNVSQQYVARFISQGRLKVGKDGKLSRKQVDAVRATMDPEAITRGRENQASGEQPRQSGEAPSPMAQARAAEAVYKARQRELIVKKLAGEVVPVTQVKGDAFEAARSVTAILRVMPQRNAGLIAASVAGKSAKEAEVIVKGILEAEVRRILTDFTAALGKITGQKVA
jgi:hypothetical protein